MSRLPRRAGFALDHRWAPRHMSEYLDGELAPRGGVRMQRHIAQCEECRRVLAGLRRMLEALPRLSQAGGRADVVQIAGAVRSRLPPAPGG
jgi:anti-sigma factor RsiW